MQYVYMCVSRLGIALVIMAGFSLWASSAFAQSAVIPNSSGSVTQLQFLLSALQNLQSQLAQLQVIQPASTVAATATATTPAYDIIIVAGQSNAVGLGQGTYTEYPYLVTATNTAKVFQLGRFKSHDMKIIPVTHEPLEFWGRVATYGTTTNGLRGFAYPFALRYAFALPANRKVLIIPAAKGGTSILEWDNVINAFGSATATSSDVYSGAPDSTILYDDMVSRVRAVLAQNPKNRVVAFLWHQGGADMNALYSIDSPLHPFMSSEATYRSKLQRFHDRVRNEFADQGCFPIILGEAVVGNIPDYSPRNSGITPLQARNAIARSVQTVSRETTGVCIGKTGLASSTGATANPTQIFHFDAKGQWLMAKRYWNVFTELRK